MTSVVVVVVGGRFSCATNCRMVGGCSGMVQQDGMGRIGGGGAKVTSR